MPRIPPMSENPVLHALETRKKCTDQLTLLIAALDKIDPKLQMNEIQRITENIGKLIESYKKSTQILSESTFLSDTQLTLLQHQETQWKEFLKKMKNFNLKFQNKYIEWQKLNQKFQNQEMIKRSYQN